MEPPLNINENNGLGADNRKEVMKMYNDMTKEYRRAYYSKYNADPANEAKRKERYIAKRAECLAKSRERYQVNRDAILKRRRERYREKKMMQRVVEA